MAQVHQRYERDKLGCNLHFLPYTFWLLVSGPQINAFSDVKDFSDDLLTLAITRELSKPRGSLKTEPYWANHEYFYLFWIFSPSKIHDTLGQSLLAEAYLWLTNKISVRL